MQTVDIRNLAAFTSQEHRESAEWLFERVSGALLWTHIVNNKVERIASLDQWRHRQLPDIESDLAYLEINRQELLLALSEYLSKPELSSKQADWLFLNVLVYAEYVATVSEIRKKLMGLDRYVKSLFPPRYEHITDVSIFAKRAWHFPAALLLVLVGWMAHPIAGFGATGYVLFSIYRRREASRQVNELLSDMLRTYFSFNTLDLSWVQVTHMLESSRDAGAVWDSSLYALAESRAIAVRR